MAHARKILIVDPDPATARALAPALRRRGCQVHGARDGTRGLQVAILRFPDMVLFDERTPLLDARTFLRILRTNPRTERIPVILTGDSADPDKVRVGAFLKKPFNQDEVVARIEQVFRKVEAARAVSGEGRELEGNLAQIPLSDLLQILAVNRKSGVLSVERERVRGEVALAEGRVAQARVGAVAGEKAVYRLLGWREGQFAFAPGPAPDIRAMDKKLDELLLEGLRQSDEAAVLLPSLPGPGQILELGVAPAEIPAGLHPVTAEVVELLARPRPFADVLDAATASDLEVMRAVAALLERGYARARDLRPEPAGEARLLAPQELHALRARIARGRASGHQTVGKVILAGGGPLSRRAALARFAAVPGFSPEPDGERFFGTVGRLDLGEVRVDVCALPGDRSQRPLWRPFGAGAVGALVLLPADEIEPLLDELTVGMKLPVVVCGPARGAIPETLWKAPAGMAFEGPDAAEGLRALLAGAGVKKPAY